MGFLSEAAAEASNDDVTEGGAAETADTSPAPANDNAGPSLKPEGEPVKLTRREAAAQRNRERNDISAKLDAMTKTFGESQKAWETKFQQISEENARHRGAFEMLTRQQQIQQGAPQPAQQQRKSPDQMRREAQAALDAGKFDDWQTLYKDSILEEMRGLIPQQQAPQEGPNPMVMAMMSQFPAVVNAGERGRQLAIIKDMELAALGHPDGPDRYRKAFELASNTLGGAQQQTPQFSQQSRGALAGVPNNRNGGAQGGGEPGIVLSPWQREVARRCGMSIEEYATLYAEGHPDQIKNA